MTRHPLSASRQIQERWVIEGDLVLHTPTHLGGGDTDGLVDMPLLLDEATGRALLPGTSLAGALRNYVRERRHGFDTSRTIDRDIELLFGAEKGNDKGPQSSLIIDDAVGEAPKIELRDGVRIDPVTRAAKIRYDNGTLRGYKYDIQFLEAGTTFPLRLELLLTETNQQQAKQLLALALDGLARGDIAIGLRKRRGFGECKVANWRVRRYDLRQPDGLIAWLRAERPDWKDLPSQPTQHGDDIAALLGVSQQRLDDKRQICRLQARFILDGSILIRAGFGEQDRSVDTVHLHSARPGGERKPVLSGTSLAGALRHRAERIVRTLSRQNAALAIIDDVFGPAEISRGQKVTSASRLVVKETVIERPFNLVQNRIRIDRFTGSVHGTGLFNEQPVFGTNDTIVTIDLTLRNPKDEEIGLLLLLLKDLWTGDLPLGGEVSIGRGRLRGMQATMTTPQHPSTSITIEGNDQGMLRISHRDELEQYVVALQAKVG